MPQRMILLTATAITAFVLVLVGGLLTRLSNAPAIPPADVAAREAAYQEQIRLANERIAQANALLAQATAQTRTNAPAAQPAAPAAPVAVLPTDAAAIASRLAPGARLLRDPELVSYDGTPAYAVTFDLGTVYIDATSGALLASDITEMAVAQDTNVTRREHDDDEHERSEHDEHEHTEGDHD